ncbi:MAG: protein kinase [Planctomycetota bacterium]
MPRDTDQEFARIAVERGLMGRAQADRLLADVEAAAALGSAEGFATVAVKQELISEAQRAEIDRQVAGALDRRIEIGGFEIIERIGRGGMGAVYRARQVSMDREIALKVLARRLARNEAYVKRFVREARAAARLDHPHIVQGIDVGKSSGYYYFAMEFVEGETAAEKVTREGPLDEEEALRICRQIARALDHAHQRANIIHRDVKPQNILLSRAGPAKLADLGLARQKIQGDSTVTSSGITLGTPDYIAPEQIRGEIGLDGRCDIYALGATLYHLLVGHPPYRGETANVTMARHLTDPVPDLTADRPDVSPSAAAVVRWAMQKEKADRFQTAAEMADAIGRALDGEPVQPPPTTEPRRPRPVRRPKPAGRPLVAALWIAGVAFAAALAVLVLGRPGGDRASGGRRRLASPTDDGAPGKTNDDPAGPPPDPEPAPPDDPGPEPPDDPWSGDPTGGFEAPEPDDPDRPPPGQKVFRDAKELVAQHRDEPWVLVPRLDRMARSARGTHFEGAVSAMLDNARYDLRRAAEENLAGARAAAEKEDLDAALDLADAVTGWDVPELSGRARELIASWRAAKKERARGARARRLAARLGYYDRIASALRARDYAAARALAAKAAADPELGKLAREFDQLGKDIGELAALWGEVEARLRAKRPGDPIRLGSMLMRFEAYRDGVVIGNAKKLPARELSEIDLFASKGLLEPYFEANERNATAYWRRGLWHTFDRFARLDEARSDFARAEELGAKDAARRGRRYVQRVEQLIPEQAAVGLLADARAAAEARDWKKVRAALGELAKHRKTRAARETRSEQTKLMLLAAGRGRGLDTLFCGEVELEGSDRLTVRYDLGRSAHRADWRGAKPAPGGVRFDHFLRWAGGVRLASVRLVFRAPGPTAGFQVLPQCTAQGSEALVEATVTTAGGGRCILDGRDRQAAEASIKKDTSTSLALELRKDKASLAIDGRTVATVATGEVPPENRSIHLVANGGPVAVSRATVVGTLDLAWAKQRAEDLADVAEGRALKTVEVRADRPWTATGVRLESGTYYHVRAEGLWRYGRGERQAAAAPGRFWQRNDLPLFSLVATVDDTPVYVGDERIIGPFLSGPLKLGMNEVPGGCDDNAGALTVRITRLGRPAPPIRPGLIARYYGDRELRDLKRTGIVPNIDFERRALRQQAGQRDNFSARWEGLVRVERPGRYELGFVSDDGLRLFVNGRKVIDKWHIGRRNRGTTGPISLTAGLHPITVEFYQGRGNAYVKLFWRPPGGEGRIAPAGLFFHSRKRAAELGVK